MARAEPQNVKAPSIEERHRQVERVLGSVTFSNTPGLKCFLQFIASLAEQGRTHEISEYAIAIEVFGRPPNFDPTSDTIVRTQAYRLRLRLKEYYEGEGKDDLVVIEVPKGHYVPLFQFRPGSGLQEPIPPTEVPARPEPVSAAPAAVRGKLWMRRTGVILLALVMFIGGAAVGARWLGRRQSASAANLPQGIESQFWSGFLGSDRHIIVSFMDFHYLASDSGALLPIRWGSPMAERGVPADPTAAANPKMAAMAGRLTYENGFAALGDMVGMHDLAMLFTKLGAAVTATRVHQLTLDELKDADLVFLGQFTGRANQIWLTEHRPWRFAFGQTGPHVWEEAIVDTGAPGGATSQFVLGFEAGSHVLRTDYALISVVPGVNPTHRVVILGGLTTTGTQGAAEFLTSEAGLRDLLTAIGTRENGRLVFPQFFQCVLRVEVAHGLDVISTKYVTGAALQLKQ